MGLCVHPGFFFGWLSILLTIAYLWTGLGNVLQSFSFLCGQFPFVFIGMEGEKPQGKIIQWHGVQHTDGPQLYIYTEAGQNGATQVLTKFLEAVNFWWERTGCSSTLARQNDSGLFGSLWIWTIVIFKSQKNSTPLESLYTIWKPMPMFIHALVISHV